MTISKENETQVLFASLNLPPFPAQEILDEIKALPEESWKDDEYRNAKVLALMTSTGGHDLEDLRNQSVSGTDYLWTKYAPQSLQSYFEMHMWPWMGSKSRMTILRTEAGMSINEHIDCSKDMMGKVQLKLRFVLQGKSDTLYFIHSKGIFTIPQTNSFYLIDGSWPHGMKNQTEDRKYTICLGSPWSHAVTYPAVEKLVTTEAFERPSSLDHYFR